MHLNMADLLAKHWGLDPDSDELRRKRREARERARRGGSAGILVPCGEPCQKCGDNPHTCACQ